MSSCVISRRAVVAEADDWPADAAAVAAAMRRHQHVATAATRCRRHRRL